MVDEKIQPDRFATEIGVSWTPVLNVLKRLAAEHIVECIPVVECFWRGCQNGELVRLLEVRWRWSACPPGCQQLNRWSSAVSSFRDGRQPHTKAAVRYLERDGYVRQHPKSFMGYTLA